MPKTKEDYTLWNSPSDKWTKVLEGVEITRDTEREIAQAKQRIDSKQIEDRLKPFETLVTEKTMSQLVG